jgi:AcrR family transcriptional regulator
MDEGPGLRERKKRETRQLISDVATGLFATRGFDHVTVAEIAAAANVSKMTVFNYFPRKEDLFFDRQEEGEALLERLVRQRAPGESVVAVLRRGVLDLIAERHPLAGLRDGAPLFWDVVQASPALQARARELNEELERALARLLVAETGAEPDDERPRLVAAMVIGVYRRVYGAALRRLQGGTTADAAYPDHVRLVNQAFDLLESGIGDYGARPA